MHMDYESTYGRNAVESYEAFEIRPDLQWKNVPWKIHYNQCVCVCVHFFFISPFISLRCCKRSCELCSGVFCSLLPVPWKLVHAPREFSLSTFVGVCVCVQCTVHAPNKF